MAGESEILKLLGAGGTAAASAINPAMAIAGAAQPLFQGILGLTQGARARAISKRYPRPDYMIPGAATNALNDQRNMAMGQSPGLGIAQQQLAQSQAGSAAAIMNSGGGGNETLAALTKLDQNAGDQGLDLAAMQEQYKANEMGKYINQQNAYAQWQEKKRDWDVMQPYIQAQEKAAAMNDAANVNIDEALRTGGGLVAQSLVKNDTPKLGAAAKTGLAGGNLGAAVGGAILGKMSPSNIKAVNTIDTPPVVGTTDATQLPIRQGDGTGIVLRSNAGEPAAVAPANALSPVLGNVGGRQGRLGRGNLGIPIGLPDNPFKKRDQGVDNPMVMTSRSPDIGLSVTPPVDTRTFESSSNGSALTPLLGKIAGRLPQLGTQTLGIPRGLPPEPFKKNATPSAPPLSESKPELPAKVDNTDYSKMLIGNLPQVGGAKTAPMLDYARKYSMATPPKEYLDLPKALEAKDQKRPELDYARESKMTTQPKADLEYPKALNTDKKEYPKLGYERKSLPATEPKVDAGYPKALDAKDKKHVKLDYVKVPKEPSDRKIKESVGGKKEPAQYSRETVPANLRGVLDAKDKPFKDLQANTPSEPWINQKPRAFTEFLTKSDGTNRPADYKWYQPPFESKPEWGDAEWNAANRESHAKGEMLPASEVNARIIADDKAELSRVFEKHKDVPFVKELKESVDGSAFMKYGDLQNTGKDLYLYQIIENGMDKGVALGPKHPNHDGDISITGVNWADYNPGGGGGTVMNNRKLFEGNYVIFDGPRQGNNEAMAGDLQQQIWRLSSAKKEEVDRLAAMEKNEAKVGKK